MKRVVSVWLPDWPITVWSRPGLGPSTPPPTPPEGAPFALVERGPRGLMLSALNDAARAARLHCGQSHADARAILPDLVSAPAEPDRDADALRRLALWAERFSPAVTVEAQPPGFEGLSLDMTGGAHLFGGEAALLGDIRGRLTRAAIPARLAIADTPAAAWAMARFGGRDEAIVPAGRTREAIADLPIEALRLDQAAVTLLKRFGLKRIGDLYRLPRAGLARRFRGEAGLAVVERLDQALGAAAEALTPERAAPAYRAWTQFAEPLIDIEGVAVHLPGLARALSDQLDRDGRGARRLALVAFRVDGRTTAIEAGLSAPSAAPAHMLRLLREKGLERLDLGFGVDALMLSALTAEPVAARGILLPLREKVAPEGGRMRGRADLSEQCRPYGGEAGATPHPSASPTPSPARGEGLSLLIDRLQAKLGEDAVRRPRMMESWLPERSEAWVKAGPAPPTPADHDQDRPRPILLFDPPEPVETIAEAPDGVPARFTWRRAPRRVVKADGPERLSREWWRPAADARTARTRDYYRVEDDQGRRYWLFREGLYGREDADHPPRWWLHGVFA